MIDIIYKDRDICICKKPRGVLSEGEGEQALPFLLRKELDEAAVFAVHRLDRETEGLMVYALNKKAAAALSAEIVEGKMRKEYIAELCGIPEKEEDRLCDLLFYDRKRGRSYVVSRIRQGVKEAILEYKLLEAKDGYSKVRVRLFTGRTHQIRVQFASRGLPLRGDRRYGAPKESGAFSLTACYLSFAHPSTGEILEFGDKNTL